METRTLFSDESKYYRLPAEPDPFDTVKIRFRTGRYQANNVFFCCDGDEIRMSWESERNNFDYYSHKVALGSGILYYHFKIETDEAIVYYGRNGAATSADAVKLFSVIPGFHTPQWSKGCLYYQIFPDRFYNADPVCDVCDSEYLYGGQRVLRSSWGDPVSSQTFRQFYGGDLKGVIQKLPYLLSLGIEAIYLNPVFASPSSHKYDCCDYEHVDFGFGSSKNEEEADHTLAVLIEEAHKAGIRVVLDGVFNHCSSYHKWFDKSHRFSSGKKGSGAYGNPKSRYHDRFSFFDEECKEYEAWWDVPTLPKLNYEGSPSLEEDILGIGRKWISPPYNADGWRLDVAADLGHSTEYNHQFWQKFRHSVRQVKEDTLIIAEHYESPAPWLNGREWDSVMNYQAFMDPVSYFFTGMEKHSDLYIPELKGNAEHLAEVLTEQSADLPGCSLLSSLNQLDNHDHSRFLTRTNHRAQRLLKDDPESASAEVDPAVLRQAAAFMYFWPGSPGLYYGDEAGVCGFTDPDNRRCYPWGTEDDSLLQFFRELGELRKTVPFIKEASCRILYAQDGIFSFARFTDKSALIVTVSASDESHEITLPVWIAGLPGYERTRMLDCVLISYQGGYSFEQKPFVSHYGIIKTAIAPGNVFVLVSG